MIVAIDPGDLNRDGSPKSECIGRVRDGDKGDIINGYPLMHVVARDVKTGQSLPLLTRLGSAPCKILWRWQALLPERQPRKNAQNTLTRSRQCRPVSSVLVIS